VVLSVREDVLASLLARLDPQSNVLRLGPLAPAAAREAIVGPLIERRIAIEEPLLVALLAELERAAALLAGELRWPAAHAVYPPHLQLACSALFEQLDPGEDVLALRHYEKLGGLDEIVRDYLDRVLETELPAELVAIARRVLLALVASDRTRAVRTDAELADQLPAEAKLAPVLEVLRQRGIVVPLRAANGQPAWELVHDSLVPRVLAWSDRADLARQRALEIVRHHLRGSRGGRPSLLSRAELREIQPFDAAVEELDREWARRAPSTWNAKRLVAQSTRVVRERWIVLALSIAVAVGAAGFLGLRWFEEREQRRQEELLARSDIGSFVLELEPFDWDPKTLRAIPVAADQLSLSWKLVAPDPSDELAPTTTGLDVDRERLAAPGRPTIAQWLVEARGGRAVLVVSGRGRQGRACNPAIIPLEHLPGYALRGTTRVVHLRVPTCQATWSDEIVVPASAYISGGTGELGSASHIADEGDVIPEKTLALAAYAIDRTEVTNGAYRLAVTDYGALTAPMFPNTAHIGDEAGYL
ncbi:MAG: hypothetical protein ABI678_33135, partial [Kofleriaceae bacterium]